MPRIHILGASGSGTTTLGVALAVRLAVRHVDSDDLFWLPTDPPFTERRSAKDRLAMLLERLPVDEGWIFSGSAVDWAQPLEPFYDLVVFLRLDPAVRMARLRQREAALFGGRIEAGGDRAEAYAAFLVWAASYDRPDAEGRSLAKHERWLASQRVPVLRLDAIAPVPELTEEVLRALARE